MSGPLTLALAASGSSVAPAITEPWVTPDELSNCSVDSSGVDLDSVCAAATAMLGRMSGNRFGVRTETVRPYAGMSSIGWGYFVPYEFSNYWGDWLSLDRGPTWIKLAAPVRDILAIKIDGTTLASTDYFLYENELLQRATTSTNSTLCWPVNQDLSLPDTEVGTFSISYQWGLDVPPDGLLAAQQFACQLAKYVAGDDSCVLSDRVTQVNRQGVTITISDPNQFVQQNRTGLYLVDAFLESVGNGRRPTVTSPDTLQLLRPTN